MGIKEREKAIEEYNKIKDKYNLPSLEEIEKEFGMTLIEPWVIHAQLINIAIKKATDIKITFENFIAPPVSYNSMFESKFLEEKEKKELMKKYSELMSLLWELTLLKTKGGEENCINGFKKFYDFWKKEKEFLINLIEKVTNKWKEEKEKENDRGKYIV